MDERARAVKLTVGEELICQRRTLGVGLESLADRTGLDTTTINRIEGGEVRPRQVALAALALALGTTQSRVRRQWLTADTCFARLIQALRAGEERGPGLHCMAPPRRWRTYPGGGAMPSLWPRLGQ